VHKNAVDLGALASRYRVASPQAGALQGGAGSIAVCAMDVTPETRKGRPHAPWPASLSHPRKRGPCSELCRPLLRRPRAHLAVVRALPGADFAGFPTSVGVHGVPADPIASPARRSTRYLWDSTL